MARSLPTGAHARWATKLGLPLVVALVIIAASRENILTVGSIERLELASIDFRFQMRGSNPAVADSSHVVIVEISEESFKSLPDKWPWPRSYYARLVRNLSRAGARVVGLDILFVGNDMYLKRNDEDLRSAIRETGSVVLAGKSDVLMESYRLRSALENYGNVFYDVDSSLGLVNIWKDVDDVVRRYTPFFDADTGTRIPTFGFAVLNKTFGLPPSTVAENLSDDFSFAGRSVPKYDEVSLLLNYQGPNRTFPRVNFADVLDDETFLTVEEAQYGQSIDTFSDPDYGILHDKTFQGKIALVGSTMPEDQDLHSVAIGEGKQPGDNKMYGVEIHANLIESVLRSQFLVRQPQLVEVAVILFFTLVTFLVTSYLKASKTRHPALVEINGFLFAVAEVCIIAFAALELFRAHDYVVAVISPVLAVIGGYFASTAYHFVVERKQRVMIKMMFSTYVSPTIVEELIANPQKLTLGGERKELTVLFSDLEGFTTVAESMAPERLVSLMNEYLSAMTQIVLRNYGTLDKYEGDLVMAFWGAPVPQDDHAVHACSAALEMQGSLAALRSQWAMQQRPLFFARIGINTGDMVVGNMGSVEKFNYTVIGDSVNIASRLEGANKSYKTSILLGENTYQKVKDLFLCRELDLIIVKGRSEPLTIYELCGRSNGASPATLEPFLALYHSGLRFYKERRWREARGKLEQAASLSGGDYPTKLYLDRIKYFEQQPPPKDWDGVFLTTTK